MTTALTVGISTNDRMLPLLLGDVPTPGLDLTFDRSSPNDIFRRALQEGDFDVTEMSFAAHAILISRDKQPFVGLPIFVSRMFRHGCVFVRALVVVARVDATPPRRGRRMQRSVA